MENEQLYIFLQENGLPNEMWKPVNKSNGKYYISNIGRIISLKAKHPKFLSLQPRSYNSVTYFDVTLRINNRQEKVRVHRLVANAFVENPKPKLFKEVDHINGEGTDNRAENLRWCSHTQNMNNPNTKIKMSIYHFTKGHKSKLANVQFSTCRE